MNGCIFCQIAARELEERARRAETVLLQMHKSPGELNQSFVEIAIKPAPVRQPQFLQHIVRLVEKLAVKTVEESQVVRIQVLATEGFNALCDLTTLLAHCGSLRSRFPTLKHQTPNGTGAGTEIDNFPALRQSGRMAKPALGRGLGALMGGTPVISKPAPTVHVVPTDLPTGPAGASPETPQTGDRVLHVPLERVRPCSLQPRKDFSAEALRELADSIKEQGIVQPLIVREQGSHLELIAGERRWRAAQLVGLTEVPVIVRQADDRAVLEMALIENLQRENLNPIEEAQGYAQLVSQFQLTQEEVAGKVGKSRALVANALRLLKLSPTIQGFIREGRLSVGHAKVILGLNDDRQQKLAAERIIKEALNVRQTEGLVAKLQAREAHRSVKPGVVTPLPRDAQVADLENRLRERLGTKVQLRYALGKGALEISFFSDAELERLLQILGVTPE